MQVAWPLDSDALDAEQGLLAAAQPPPWPSPAAAERLAVAGCFLAFAHGEQGPGNTGDRGWAAAVIIDCRTWRTLAHHCVPAVAGAPYEPGRLALREGPSLAAAIEGLPIRPDVLMVDATGRDHPRRAGLALQLGAVLDLPSVGVTHRPLSASGGQPGSGVGSSTDLVLDDEVVGAWLRTRRGVRPVAVHAGWRTDARTAVNVALASTDRARTPEPLRRARLLARTTRAHAEGRTSQPWRDPLGEPGPHRRVG